MQQMKIDELEAQVQAYKRLCHERDWHLGVMFAVALVLLLSAILSLNLLPRIVLLALVATSLLIIFGEGLYILITAPAFHRAHAPRCPRCTRRLDILQIDPDGVGTLIRLSQRADIDAETCELIREHLREHTTLRCKRCGELVIDAY